MRRLLTAILLLATLTSLGSAQAVNTDSAGLALKGFDPVAYFTMQRATPGDPQYTAVHEGATYRFASAANRDTFAKEAAKYAPQYGGYCAFGVAGGYKVKVDPEAFSVRDGKLYLNYDARVQARWLKDVPGYLSKSEANWSALKDKPRRDKVGS
jgi:YHS domain-containing protein